MGPAFGRRCERSTPGRAPVPYRRPRTGTCRASREPVPAGPRAVRSHGGMHGGPHQTTGASLTVQPPGDGRAPAVEVDGLAKRYPEVGCRLPRRCQLPSPTGRGVRLSRPERRRQVDDHRHPHHAHPTHRGAGPSSPGSTWWPTRWGPAACSAWSPSRTISTGRSRSARTSCSTPAITVSPGRNASALADALLDQFGLADRPDGQPDDFSGGQIQRMMIARALMHAPAVLFLDEPSTGLDPAARLFLWEKVAELQRGRHDGGDHHPRHGRSRHLERPGRHHRPRHAPRPRYARRPGARHASERTLDCTVDPGPTAEPARSAATIGAPPGVREAERLDDPVTGAAGGSGSTSRARPRRLRCSRRPRHQAAGGSLTDARLGEPNLEDVFIHLTGRALR